MKNLNNNDKLDNKFDYDYKVKYVVEPMWASSAGIIMGVLTGFMNDDLEGLVKDTVVLNLGSFPLIGHYLSKKSWSKVYQESPYTAMGYVIGRSMVSYIKNK
jgi:hypothetical protein